MKKPFIIAFLLISNVIFSQKKAVKKFQTKATEIEISTLGLDDFILENSDSEFIEVYLYAENSNKQHIIFNEEFNITKIKFFIDEIKAEETVFRKFITKRLEIANAVVKIPKGKEVTILGENINVESKNYVGNLNIFIEKGIVKLNTVQANATVKMYAGNVFATVKNANINVVSNLGKIEIDAKIFQKKYKKIDKKNKYNFSINSVKTNIFLTTK